MPRIVLSIAAAFLTIGTTAALAEPTQPYSAKPPKITYCHNEGGTSSDAIPPAGCTPEGLPKLIAEVNAAFDAALASTTGLTLVLLKRDQAWFAENIDASDFLQTAATDEDVAAHETRSSALLTARIEELKAIATAPKAAGLTGRWVNALASIDIKQKNGVLTASAEVKPVYGPFQDRERCAFSIALAAGNGIWHEGDVLVVNDNGDVEEEAPSYEGAPKHHLKAARQGETLRITAFGNETCGQLTGTYFFMASAEGETAPASKPASIVSPTFDCSKPSSATDEEICADPELAEADQRMNRAWKSAAAMLDKSSFAELKSDQRAYLDALGSFYQYHLHPYWNKQTYYMFFVDDARDAVLKVMRERIALLEGLEPARKDWSGIWAANDAQITITVNEQGTRVVSGGKWEHGDYKSYCEFGMILDPNGSGRIASDNSTSADLKPSSGEPNGLKLVRESAVLALSGTPIPDDGSICRRNLKPATRFFPVKPSPDLAPENLMR